ncbi:MAG: chorismate synthase, partial [Thermodesulfobacteriota bacterium]
MLRYLTGGESHGKGMTAILEGVPSGLFLKEGDVDKELARRQKGYGRGGRMAIEKDRVEITSGVRWEKTLGSPITMIVANLDWDNWKEIMAVAGCRMPDAEYQDVTRPRPGHADLTGAIKYNQRDVRNILERSSARETAARVAVGAVCKRLLDEFGVKVMSWVVEIGGVKIGSKFKIQNSKLEDTFYKAENSVVRCPGKKTEKLMIEKIDEVKERGDSVGGIFEMVVTGLPPGLGSHVHWDRKLDGRLAQAVMSIQAIKG